MESQRCLCSSDGDVALWLKCPLGRGRGTSGSAAAGGKQGPRVPKRWASERKNDRSGKSVVGVKIHVNPSALLILVVACSILLLEAALPSSCWATVFVFVSFARVTANLWLRAALYLIGSDLIPCLETSAENKTS